MSQDSQSRLVRIQNFKFKLTCSAAQIKSAQIYWIDLSKIDPIVEVLSHHFWDRRDHECLKAFRTEKAKDFLTW